MEIMTDTLINFTIFSIFLVLLAVFFVYIALKMLGEPVSVMLFSLASGCLFALCIVLFFKGLPFVFRFHIPLKGILALIPLCSAPLVPFVGYNVEITGNAILDSLLVGILLALFITVMGTGYAVVLNQGCYLVVCKLAVIIGLFLGILIRAVLWALE